MRYAWTRVLWLLVKAGEKGVGHLDKLLVKPYLCAMCVRVFVEVFELYVLFRSLIKFECVSVIK